MIIICGDTHIRADEYYKKFFYEFLDWIENQSWNVPENTFIHMGDVFDQFYRTSKLTEIETNLALDFLIQRIKCKQKIIINGNHDEYHSKFALEIFQSFKNIKVYTRPDVATIEGQKIALMPHYDAHIHEDFDNMFVDYESGGLFEQKFGNTFNFILGHYSDVKIFNMHQFNIDWIKGTKILGHVHKSNAGPNFIGTPFVTRADEKGKTSEIITIEDEVMSKIQVPQFFDYIDVTYGELPQVQMTRMLNIIDAPSTDSAKDLYKDYFIHKIILKEDTTNTVVDKENTTEKKPISEYMTEFTQINEIKDPLKSKLFELIA